MDLRGRVAQGVRQWARLHLQGQGRPQGQARHLDLIIDEGPEDAKGKTSKCIYKLDGEKLILCVSLPGKDRPKEFEQSEGESFLFELKKEKAKDKEEKKKD